MFTRICGLGITSEAALTRLAFIIDFSLVTHHPSLITFTKALTKGSTPKKSGTRVGFQEIGIRETSRTIARNRQNHNDLISFISDLCLLRVTPGLWGPLTHHQSLIASLSSLFV